MRSNNASKLQKREMQDLNKFDWVAGTVIWWTYQDRRMNRKSGLQQELMLLFIVYCIWSANLNPTFNYYFTVTMILYINWSFQKLNVLDTFSKWPFTLLIKLFRIRYMSIIMIQRTILFFKTLDQKLLYAGACISWNGYHFRCFVIKLISITKYSWEM